MTPHVLSFPCASSLRLDAALQYLLETDPTNIYNPYPDIAGIRSFHQARTQPLVRITYLSFCAYWDVMYLHLCHELGHLLLDHTPFKVWV
jgi:hypothetical protein